MYHMIAAKHRAHLRRRQHGHQWQMNPQRTDLVAPTLGPVECLKQQPGFSSADGLADFLKPGNGEPRPARKPNRINAALHQKSLDAVR